MKHTHFTGQYFLFCFVSGAISNCFKKCSYYFYLQTRNNSEDSSDCRSFVIQSTPSFIISLIEIIFSVVCLKNFPDYSSHDEQDYRNSDANDDGDRLICAQCFLTRDLLPSVLLPFSFIGVVGGGRWHA